MNRERILRIVPHNSSGGWAFIGSGNRKPSRVVKTFDEAELVASQIRPKLYKRIVLHPSVMQARVGACRGKVNSRGDVCL